MGQARAKLKSTTKRPAMRKAPKASGPAQKFTVSHQREEDFKADGLRAYAKYRDLGLSNATHGMVQAHVIRLLPPFRREEVSKRHYHEVDFQMVYVLKGWIETDLKGQGPIVMKAGSCWIQPNGIEHAVTGYSDDCEVLEIVLPANFKTVELE